MMMPVFHRWYIVALAFAVCGALSRFLYFPNSWVVWILFPLPFGLLGAWLFARRHWFMFAPLAVGVWCAAYYTAMALGGSNNFVSFSGGGIVGGLGLTLSAMLFSPKKIALGTVAGWLGSLSFLVVGNLEGDIAICFAIWQGLVGTTLWWLSTGKSNG